MQIHKKYREALEFGIHHVAKPLGIALGSAVSAMIHLSCEGALLEPAVIDDVDYGVNDGAKATGKAIAKESFRAGFCAAASASNLAHSIYRKKTFSEREYKVEARQGLISGGAAVGGIGGAIAGQVAIPVPILGAAVGGMIGSVIGQMAGRTEGAALASKLASEEDINTLPEIVQNCDIEPSQLST